MFENISAFRMSAALAKHAGTAQAVVAQNIANADTPGYIARGMPAFATVYMPANDAGNRPAQFLRASRPGHLHGTQDGSMVAEPQEMKSIASPNENQVSLETEMLKSVEAKRQHDRALAIYKTSLTVLRGVMQTR
ncbi:MAG: FlgB family protein [Pseudomonadota bacterium]